MNGLRQVAGEHEIAISLREAARRLGLSVRTIERERDRGNIRCMKLGRLWRIRLSALREYMDDAEKAGSFESI